MVEDIHKLVDDVIALLESIKYSRLTDEEKVMIENINAFGKEVKESIEEYEEVENLKDVIWAKCIRMDNDYEFTLSKNKKIKTQGVIEQ